MRKFVIALFVVVAALGLTVSGGRAATLEISSWAVNINGQLFDSLVDDLSTLPSSVDLSLFDLASGLGTLTITFAPGVAGDYVIGAFFDHDIAPQDNTFFNEFGAVTGTPLASATFRQSWEIDQPAGDIFSHFATGSLDNTNSIPSNTPDDVSLAFGWDVHLGAGDIAHISFLASQTTPTGFYLAHADPDSAVTLYGSSDLHLSPSPLANPPHVIPEPGTLALVGGWSGGPAHPAMATAAPTLPVAGAAHRTYRMARGAQTGCRETPAGVPREKERMPRVGWSCACASSR